MLDEDSAKMNSTIRWPVNEEAESLITSLKYSILELSLIGISMSVGSLLTILGNIFVLIVYAKTKSLQTPKNYFILSLAVADVIIAAIPVNLYTVYMLYGYWPLGHILCNAWLIIDYWACTVSTLTLLAIAFDRFYAVYYPILHRMRLSKFYVRKVILSIWIVAFCVWAPAILIYPHAKGENTVSHDQCYIQFLLESWHVTFATAFFSYYGPLLITVILYTSISVKLMRRCQTMKAQTKNEMHKIEASAASKTRLCTAPSASLSCTGSVTVIEPNYPSTCSSNASSISSTYSKSLDENHHLTLAALKENNLTIPISTTLSSTTSALPPTISTLSPTTISTLITPAESLSCETNATISSHGTDSSNKSIEDVISRREIFVVSHKQAAFDNHCFKHSEEIHLPDIKIENAVENPSPETDTMKTCCTKHKKLSKYLETPLQHRKLRKRHNVFANHPHQSVEGRQKALRAHKRGIRLLLLVILAFAISWMPYYLSTVIVSFTNIRLPEPLWRFCYIIGWFNSLLNPLCYPFGSREFKKGFMKVICKKKKIKRTFTEEVSR